MRAVFVGLLVLGHILPERFLALPASALQRANTAYLSEWRPDWDEGGSYLLAQKDHLHRFAQVVVLRFGVALGALRVISKSSMP
jgi:hypothetical protein